MFGLKFINLASAHGARDTGTPRCLIFDDSSLPKTGRYIKKVSRKWVQALNRCILGYKLLAIGYWDGTSFIPPDFSLNRERAKEGDNSKIESALEMFW